jgi:hypothetical protein
MYPLPVVRHLESHAMHWLNRVAIRTIQALYSYCCWDLLVVGKGRKLEILSGSLSLAILYNQSRTPGQQTTGLSYACLLYMADHGAWFYICLTSDQ